MRGRRPWLSAIVLAFAASGAALAQDLERKLEAKLAEPWLTSAKWFTDYDEALKSAKQQKLPIFGYFTRSYAECAPCARVERGLFSSEAFAAWSKEVVLFAHVTSRIPGRKHDGLASEKGGLGFPYLVVMDDAGRVLATVPGRSLGDLKRATGRARVYVRLKDEKTRPPTDELALLGAEVALNLVKPSEARKRLASIELSAEAKAPVVDVIARKEFDAELATILGGQKDPRTVGPKLWTAYQEGRRPTEDFDNRWCGAFYEALLGHGLNARVPAAARAGYEGMKRVYATYPQAKGPLEQMRAEVERLEAERARAEGDE